MKAFKLTLPLILVVIVMSLANAQTKTDVERKVLHLKEFLSLNDDQTTKITDILTKADNNLPSEKSGKSMNKRAMMKDTRVRMTAIDKEIEPLLTAEQLKKYDSYKKERTNQMRSRMKGRKFKED